MLISRTDRGLMANWWFTVDRLLMAAVLLLMVMGVLFSMAASPPVAERIGLEYFHFVKRQLMFLVPALVVLIGASLLTRRQARRSSLWAFLAGIGLMVYAVYFGPEIKGAHRWVAFGNFNIQPSEFVKPAFVVLAAWLLAEGRRRPDMPGTLAAWVAFAVFLALLAVQPDFGQAVLVAMVWMLMLLVFGIPWIFVFGLAGLGVVAIVGAYFTVPHVTSRIDRFLSPETGDTFQVDTARQAFDNGKLLGTGPGGGSAKQVLPDAHSDFTFAVIGEEFGLVACLVLIVVFGFIVLRALRHASVVDDSFATLALTGLISTFGLQAIINMGVNVSLIPAKGMTLPFISYGGSSLIAMAYAMGLVLALSRRWPKAAMPVGRFHPAAHPAKHSAGAAAAALRR
jgi:cell division protein FtsW